MAAWGVALDGKPMRTPGKNELMLPSEALAAAIAAEWDAQRDEIRPATMPLTRLAAAAIDRTNAQRDLVVAETANYADTDLLCYRADHLPAFAERQHAAWQPLVDWPSRALRRDASKSPKASSPNANPGDPRPRSPRSSRLTTLSA